MKTIILASILLGGTASLASTKPVTKCYEIQANGFSDNIQDWQIKGEAVITKAVAATLKKGFTQIIAITPLTIDRFTRSICVTASKPIRTLAL